MSKRFFCSKPFEIAEVRTNGDVHACCSGWIPMPIGSLSTKNMADIWNGIGARYLRLKMHNGDFSSCVQCPFLRQKLPSGPVVDHDSVDLSLYPVEQEQITTLNLAYDATCNLSCPSCRTSVKVASGPELRRIQSFQERLLENDFLSRVKHLHVTGSGDPFASSVFRDLLRSLRKEDYPHLTIGLQTNGQLLTPDAWQALAGAREMISSLEISVDAASDDTYAINRRGGSWAVLLDNLAFIRDLRRAGELRYLQLSFVIQANNWRELSAFRDLGRTYGADQLLCTPLRNWGTFSDAEFRSRCVHLPTHPDHAAFTVYAADFALPIFAP